MSNEKQGHAIQNCIKHLKQKVRDYLSVNIIYKNYLNHINAVNICFSVLKCLAYFK